VNTGKAGRCTRGTSANTDKSLRATNAQTKAREDALAKREKALTRREEALKKRLAALKEREDALRDITSQKYEAVLRKVAEEVLASFKKSYAVTPKQVAKKCVPKSAMRAAHERPGGQGNPPPPKRK
jgi:predicted Holliday junction resolvase-like endonuclease